MTAQAVELRCEYAVNPIGIDALRPRLSWRIQDLRRGAVQSAYQIVVSDEGGQTIWDSGAVASDRCVLVPYDGPALRSRQRCSWKVRAWDAAHEPSQWSEPAWWEMGLLARDDWHGQWVGSSEKGGPYTPAPAPYLRKGFGVDGDIAKARLYITALGLCEVEINGKPVTDEVFLPGRTQYAKRVQYHTFDVTEMVKNGDNVIGVVLGDGWYCGHIHSDPRQFYGDRPRLMAQLELTRKDRSIKTIATDGSWKVSTSGPIRSSDILMGEDYDAQLEMPGWSSPGYDESRWGGVELLEDPGVTLVARSCPSVRRTREVRPVGPPIISANKRRWIFDLGQNIVGRVRLKIAADAAAKLREKPLRTVDLRHAEMLDRDGKPYTTALRTARATDHYTLGCDGRDEVYEPRFTFHGFRYVEVRDVPGAPAGDTVVGVVLNSDLEETGSFECSDPLLNRLQQNILWSQRGNFLEIPTDCPQRDERLGWTGDAQVFARTAAFNMDVAAFFGRWLGIMADEQGEDGRIPSVVPHCPTIHNEGGPAWADAAVICPWTMYLCYGDRGMLEACYPMMSRFMGYLDATCPDRVRPGVGAKWKGYGDWLAPAGAETPPELIGTAFWAYCAVLMRKAAGVLGKEADVTRYGERGEAVAASWRKRFVDVDGNLTVRTQTAHVLALQFDLLPDGARRAAVEWLVRDIKSRETHLSTGFVGTPYLLDVLTRYGQVDLAYALLGQKTYPSWLYPVTLGATTMWERWDGWTPEKGFNDAGMNSYNHYAFGAVGAWMYSTVAGIDLDPARPGYKHIVFRPVPRAPLTYAKGVLRSPYGVIASHWRMEGEVLTLDLTVPPNTTATLHLPTTDANGVTEGGKAARSAEGVTFRGAEGGTAVFELGAGSYAFKAVIAQR